MTLPAFAEIRATPFWGLPPCVTVSGHQSDRLFFFILVLTGAVLIGTQVVFIAGLIRDRRKPGVPAHYTHGNVWLEVIWTVIPALIFLGLFLYGNALWLKLTTPPPQGKALDIEIVGEQYAWRIRYPGPDGILGRADDALETTLNPIGLDLNDPHSRNNVRTYNELVLPVGRVIHLHLRSRDVIHAIYIPEFRLYQDLVPGRSINWVSFQTERTGQFTLACNQLCGSGHYNMQGKIRVVTPEEFDQWYQAKVAALSEKNP